LISGDPRVLDQGTAYLGIVLGAAPLPLAALTSESIMRAAGDTRTPLLVDLFAIGLNAALDPLLIYGWGPIPAMGVAGAAWATVLAQAVMVASYLTLAARGHRALPLARAAPGPPVRITGMVRVGLPAALIGALFSVVYIMFARSASRYGAASLAVVGIANRIEALEFVATVAIGVAGAALVGQNLGARRPDRAVQVIRTGLVWSVWVTGTATLLLLALPQVFLDLFSHDPEVHRLGIPYLRVLALCFVFNGLEIVVAESILGSGHTLAISWIFTSFSLARIPLAFLVPDWTRSGVLGLAWLISVTCVLRALVIVAWAARGTWKRGLARELHGAEAPGAAAAPEPPGPA
jgi:putative MATE family efflux protein